MENESLNKENTQQSAENDTETANSKFIGALNAVNSSYLTVVIISAAIVAAGVAVAAFLNVAAGLAMAIVAVLFYMYTTKAILSKKLGITYRSTSGRLSVCTLRTRGQAELWIPGRLLWLDVTELESRGFDAEDAKALTAVHLPRTITNIGEYAFEDCSALSDIYYEGSAEEWAEIDCQCDISAFTLHFSDSSLFTAPKREKADKKDSAQVPPESTEDTEQE